MPDRSVLLELRNADAVVGAAVGPDGAIYVRALQGAVTFGRVDPATGRVTPVTR